MAGLIGAVIGAFGVSMGVAYIWLIFAYLIPSLRRSPHTAYGVAMVLAIVVQFLSIDGVRLVNLLAAFVSFYFLRWNMKRAVAKIESKSSPKN
jgi:hypothetical protein